MSARAGQAQLQEPPRRRQCGWQRATPPSGYIWGFGGQHWREQYHAQIIVVPQDQARTEPTWSPAWKRWLAHHRQIVETTFSVLVRVFDIRHLAAHSRWGQLTRLACKIAGYQLSIWLNRLLGRPNLAHTTLLC